MFVYMRLIVPFLLEQRQSARTAGCVCYRQDDKQPLPSSQPDGLNFVMETFSIKQVFIISEEESWKGLRVPIDLLCLEGGCD